MGQKLSKRQSEAIARALMAERLYPHLEDNENKGAAKPRLKVRPKGNPFKGKLGAVLKYEF